MTDSPRNDSPDQAIARYQAAIERAIRWIAPTDTPPDVLSLTADAAEAFAAKITSRPPGGGLWGHVSGAANSAARGVFVIGLVESGPGVPGASSTGDTVEAIFVAPAAFEGPDGAMHGGQVANLFDEVCGLAQSLGASPDGRTASLSVTYHQPVPLGQALRVSAGVTGVDGRKVTVRATIHHGETLCASAEALFVQRQI